MTTYVDFTQPQDQPFEFQATLDGQLVVVRVPWNVYRQDWYVVVSDTAGNPIVSVPRVGSPVIGENPQYLDADCIDLNLVAGYFTTSTLVWRPSTGQFEINP